MKIDFPSIHYVFRFHGSSTVSRLKLFIFYFFSEKKESGRFMYKSYVSYMNKYRTFTSIISFIVLSFPIYVEKEENFVRVVLG